MMVVITLELTLDDWDVHLGESTHVVLDHIWGFQTLIYGGIHFGGDIRRGYLLFLGVFTWSKP
jgi:hypothetical protein